MKIVRYEHQGKTSYGELKDGKVTPLTGALHNMSPVSGGTAVPLKEVKLLAPAQPSKIVAIGPGYNILLQGRPRPERPYYWLKPSTAVQDPDGEVVLPPGLTVNHEAEIAIVIGKAASHVSPEEALDHVLGYTGCIDVTAGDMSDQAAYPLTQLFVDGKIYDTFAPIGPMIVTDLDTSDLNIQLRINGEVRQNHTTADKMWPYDQLISTISKVVTLLPGDVITTGSIPEVAPLTPGDEIELEVEGIGILRNRAVAG